LRRRAARTAGQTRAFRVGPQVMQSWRTSLVVRLAEDDEVGRFAAEMAEHHWLGSRLSGRVMRYVATVDGEWVALAGFGSAALRGPVQENITHASQHKQKRRHGTKT